MVIPIQQPILVGDYVDSMKKRKKRKKKPGIVSYSPTTGIVTTQKLKKSKLFKKKGKSTYQRLLAKRGKPKTQVQRRITHKAKYGTSELPKRKYKNRI